MKHILLILLLAFSACGQSSGDGDGTDGACVNGGSVYDINDSGNSKDCVIINNDNSVHQPAEEAPAEEGAL